MVSGRSKQASEHTHARSHASVGLAQARPNNYPKLGGILLGVEPPIVGQAQIASY